MENITMFWLGAVLILLAAVYLWLRFRTGQLARQGLSLVPQAGQIQPVANGALHFVEAGDPGKPTLVLIHGLAGQLQHFTYALKKPLSEDFHVIALDRPGCGYSRRDREDQAALTEQARMIAEFLDLKKVKNPVLVGHSLGGAVALALALERPDFVAGLALICPLTQPVEEPPEVFRPFQIRSPVLRRFIARTFAVPLLNRTAQSVLRNVFAPQVCPPDFLYRGGAALGLRPEAYMAASADLVYSGPGIAALAKRYDDLTMPREILYGAKDPLLDPALHGTSMEKFGFSVTMAAGLGHMLPITNPESCETLIRRVAAQAWS
ncbi:MAG: alpha/beta hydrolase [Pseudomonadota bacterium]